MAPHFSESFINFNLGKVELFPKVFLKTWLTFLGSIAALFSNNTVTALLLFNPTHEWVLFWGIPTGILFLTPLCISNSSVKYFDSFGLKYSWGNNKECNWLALSHESKSSTSFSTNHLTSLYMIWQIMPQLSEPTQKRAPEDRRGWMHANPPSLHPAWQDSSSASMTDNLLVHFWIEAQTCCAIPPASNAGPGVQW